MSISLHYFVNISKFYMQIQAEFAYTNARLVAHHYLLSDLHGARNITINLQKLVIYKETMITYDLRHSVIPKSHHMHAYSLYREDGITRAEALVEGIIDWRIALINNVVTISLYFKDGKNLEIKACLSNV